MKSPHAPPLGGSLNGALPESAPLGAVQTCAGTSGAAAPSPSGADPAWGGPAPDRAGRAQPNGFEGSYLGNREVLRAGSRLECKICWWVYDPAQGDPQWQIAAGTPFAELPSHWRCPNCDCEPDQFLLLPDA